MITVEIQGWNQTLAKLQSIPEALQTVLAEKINFWLVEIQRKILAGLAAGAPLKSRHGDSGLAGSVQIEPAAPNPSVVAGAVFSTGLGMGKAYRYGFVQEYGGERYYDIYPVNKKALSWIGDDGKRVITHYVRHPPLMARPWFYPPGAATIPEIGPDINNAIAEVLAR